jgi:hypothetical protein
MLEEAALRPREGNIMAGHRRTLLAIGSAVAFGTGSLAVAAGIVSGVGTASADSCSQFIQPLNPYLETCGIPNPPVTVPGSSPGAGAIIACRGIPGCLSYVVNGPGLVRVPQPDTRVRQSQ